MTLEEFAKDAGCVVFEMHPDDTALHYARLLKGFADGIRARKGNT